MDRLTRPGIDADQTAVRFMDLDGEVKIQDIGDKLLDLILNGPTINGIKKDTLRQLVRQLYAELKRYEDTEVEPEELTGILRSPVYIAACVLNGAAITHERAIEIATAEVEGRLVVLPCSIDRPIYLIHQEEGQKRKPKSYRVDECDIDHFTIGEAMIPMITAVSKDNEWHELIDGTQEGYEYWLTREAAEAALAKDNNVPTKEEENHA